jgi:hypothetical protein
MTLKSDNGRALLFFVLGITGANTIQCAWRCHAARLFIRRQVQVYLKRLADEAAAGEKRRNEEDEERRNSPIRESRFAPLFAISCAPALCNLVTIETTDGKFWVSLSVLWALRTIERNGLNAWRAWQN